MGLFDERCVAIDGGEQRRSVFDDAVEKIYADGKVCAVDHRAGVFGDDLFRGRFMLLPTGRSFDERDFRARAGFDVFEHRFADREVDRDIVTAEFSAQLIDVSSLSLLVSTAPTSSPALRAPAATSWPIAPYPINAILIEYCPDECRLINQRVATEATNAFRSNKLDGLLEFTFRDPFVICVRVENRSWTKQQRLSPLRQIRNVSRESHYTLLETRHRKQSHRIVRRRIFQPPARADRIFENSFTCSISIPSRICNSARALSGITFGRVPPLITPMLHVVVPKKLSSGHSHSRIVSQNVEQLFDRRLTRFRIRRMRRAAFSGDDHAHRSLGARRQTIVSRLAIDQVTTLTRERMFVRSLRANTARALRQP